MLKLLYFEDTLAIASLGSNISSPIHASRLETRVIGVCLFFWYAFLGRTCERDAWRPIYNRGFRCLFSPNKGHRNWLGLRLRPRSPRTGCFLATLFKGNVNSVFGCFPFTTSLIATWVIAQWVNAGGRRFPKGPLWEPTWFTQNLTSKNDKYSLWGPKRKQGKPFGPHTHTHASAKHCQGIR